MVMQLDADKHLTLSLAFHNCILQDSWHAVDSNRWNAKRNSSPGFGEVSSSLCGKNARWSASLRAQIQSFMRGALVRFNLSASSLFIIWQVGEALLWGTLRGTDQQGLLRLGTLCCLLLRFKRYAYSSDTTSPKQNDLVSLGLKFEGVRITAQTLSLHIPDM